MIVVGAMVAGVARVCSVRILQALSVEGQEDYDAACNSHSKFCGSEHVSEGQEDVNLLTEITATAITGCIDV